MPPLRQDSVAEGERVYARHCAACHGADLQGQPDWKKPLPNGKYPAPPHDDSGHTWHHPDHVLYKIILNGGDGTGDMSHGDMPAFKDVLSGREVVAVLEFIKSRWSPDKREYQWRMTVEQH
jgi:mono/diheme cytochrome c family protein